MITDSILKKTENEYLCCFFLEFYDTNRKPIYLCTRSYCFSEFTLCHQFNTCTNLLFVVVILLILFDSMLLRQGCCTSLLVMV